MSEVPPLAREAWRALGQRVSARSRHLGAAFLANTEPVLAADGGVEKLHAWVDAALAFLEREAWQAQVIVELSFANAPGTVLATQAPAAWLEVALALSSAIDPQQFLSAVPAGLPLLTAADQEAFLQRIAAFAGLDTHAAQRIYRELPATLAALSHESRQQLLELLAMLQYDLQPVQLLAEIASTLPASWRVLTSAQLESSLRALGRVAGEFPEVAVAALGALPELHRHASIDHIERWIEAGLQISRERAAAAKAYFALESRESRAQLYAAASGVQLEPELGVWRKLIEMASGERAVVRRASQASLRPSLERDAAAGEVELPALVDWLDAREANRAVLRFLALQLAGRREFGTYGADFEDHITAQLRAAQPQLEQLFLVAEAVRVQHRLAHAYPGCMADTEQLMQQLLSAWHSEEVRDFDHVCDVLLAAVLAPSAAQVSRDPERNSDAPLGATTHAAWLPLDLAAELIALFEPLRDPDANVLLSLHIAKQLEARLSQHSSSLALPPAAAKTGRVSPDSQKQLASRELFGTQTSGQQLAAAAGGASAGAGRPEHSKGDSAHEHSTDDASPARADEPVQPSSLLVRSRRPQQHAAQSFLYDEWDHTIGDYRVQHCRVQELSLATDSGVFFEQTLTEARSLLAHVRRQFEHMRPERYRPLHGLEDGEDFDLNALTDARIEARIQPRRTPGTRIYTSRTRQARDVATLFLVDMSASTEQPYPEPNLPPPRRIIDTLKEALIVMTAALEKLGDLYAIYGFSSRGREHVEVYPVKAFDQVLDHNVKARIGGIEPKSGTRMGAALRHMIPKLTSVSARSKHLILLSDGFPQDHDYGVDRRTHTYGIEDTAVALREVSAAGAVPFCITVDRSGNDYLRWMCDPSQYLIIDDMAELPRELPKIYRRVARD